MSKREMWVLCGWFAAISVLRITHTPFKQLSASGKRQTYRQQRLEEWI